MRSTTRLRRSASKVIPTHLKKTVHLTFPLKRALINDHKDPLPLQGYSAVAWFIEEADAQGKRHD